MASPSSAIRLERVAWDDPRAVDLREQMDAEVLPRYAARVDTDPIALAARRTAFAVDPASMHAVLLALDADGEPLGHAALRRLEIGETVEWELKRLTTVPAARHRGVATALIAAVEADARAAGARRLLLQTGDRQPEAVALGERLGYRPIPAYPPYAGAVPEGLYFARGLQPAPGVPSD